MEVRKRNLNGDVYEFPNGLHFLDSLFGTFYLRGERKEIGKHVLPCDVPDTSEKEHVGTIERKVYMSSDLIMAPRSMTNSFSLGVFVINGEFAVRFSGIKDTHPNLISSEEESVEIVEVNPLINSRSQESIEYVRMGVVEEVFKSEKVEYVEVL